MKTTMKKVAAIVMVSAMALAMAACKKGAKKVSVDDFKKAFELASAGTDSLKELGADVKKSSGKLVVTMEDKMYAAAVHSGDMFLSISASNDAEAVKTAKELASKLGI